MKLKVAIITLLLTTNLLACSTNMHRSVSSQQLPAGGRTCLHGMVVFGKGSYFMEHIPMLHAPHDFQVVASIQIKNKLGQIMRPDLSQKGFTIKPKKTFSLNDFIQGQLKSFEAELYEGSFEQDGILVRGYEYVVIEVQEMKLIRKLPETSKEAFLEVTDEANNVFRTDIITPENNTQVIKNMGFKKPLWCVLGPDFFEPCP